MTAIPTYILHCDEPGCSVELRFYYERQASYARAKALENGWQCLVLGDRQRDVRDYCPAHRRQG